MKETLLPISMLIADISILSIAILCIALIQLKVCKTINKMVKYLDKNKEKEEGEK